MKTLYYKVIYIDENWKEKNFLTTDYNQAIINQNKTNWRIETIYNTL